jgi:ferredoxin
VFAPTREGAIVALRVEIDRDECLSSGKCVADHPSAFGFDEDDLAVVLPGAADVSDENLKRAARSCPSGAIRLFADDGSEIHVR